MGLFGKKKSEASPSPAPNPHYNCYRETYLACEEHQEAAHQNSRPYDPQGGSTSTVYNEPGV